MVSRLRNPNVPETRPKKPNDPAIPPGRVGPRRGDRPRRRDHPPRQRPRCHPYDRSQIGGSVVSDYDPAVVVEGRPVTSDYLVLQADSSPIEFRKVEIQVLDAEQ